MNTLRLRTDYNEPTFSGVRTSTTGVYPNESSSNSNYTNVDSIDRRYSSDHVIPGFRTRINNGEAICNPTTIIHGVGTFPRAACAFSDSLYSYPDMGLVQKASISDDNGRNVFNWMSDDMLCQHVGLITYGEKKEALYPPKSPLAALGNQVLLKAYANAGKSDALSLVSIIEARKTIASMSRLVSSGGRFLAMARRLKNDRLFRNGRFPPLHVLRRASGTLADQWLEFRYGFMQLYYDSMNFAEAYSNRSKPSRERFTSHFSQDESFSDGSSSQSSFFNEVRTITRLRKDYVSAGIIVQPHGNFLEGVHRLGGEAFLQTMWEVIPFSFIVDWFVNTSDLFSAFDGIMNRQVLTSWIRYSSTMEGYFSLSSAGRSWVGGSAQYIGSYENRSFAGSEKTTEYVRIANPVLLPLPRFRVNLNWKKFLDLASLLRQGRNILR